MTRLISAAALLLVSASTLSAQAGARRAAPSTRAITEVSLTLTDTAAQRAAGKPAIIRVNYGQPHLRGRKLLTDSLVPMGQVWRLGANAATLFSTDVALTLGGREVPAGRYVAQVIPEQSGWSLILQQETTGAAEVMLSRYDKAKDFARIPLTAATVMHPVESLVITLVPSTAPGAQKGTFNVMWGTVQLSTEWMVK